MAEQEAAGGVGVGRGAGVRGGELRAGFTVSVGKTEISVLFPVFATHREANFGPESG